MKVGVPRAKLRIIGIEIGNHVFDSLHGQLAGLLVEDLAVRASQVLIRVDLLIGVRLLLELRGWIELISGGCEDLLVVLG
jgi:hypothetical protein